MCIYRKTTTRNENVRCSITLIIVGENMQAHMVILEILGLARCVHVSCSALTKPPMPRAVPAATRQRTSARAHAVHHRTASQGRPTPTRETSTVLALFLLLLSTSLDLRFCLGLCRRSRKPRLTLRLSMSWRARCTHCPAPRDHRVQRSARNLGWAMNGQHFFCGTENPHH